MILVALPMDGTEHPRLAGEENGVLKYVFVKFFFLPMDASECYRKTHNYDKQNLVRDKKSFFVVRHRKTPSLVGDCQICLNGLNPI